MHLRNYWQDNAELQGHKINLFEIFSPRSLFSGIPTRAHFQSCLEQAQTTLNQWQARLLK